MNRRGLVGAAAVLFVLSLVLAGIGYDRYVVDRTVVRARVARLVVTTPPPGFTKKPTGSSQVATSSSPFSYFKSAAKTSPSSTAAYSVSWSDPASSSDSATVLVSYLAKPSQAARVESQAVTQFLGSSSFKSENYAFSGPIPVPGVPGGKGSVFTATGKATTPPVAAVAFSTGRAQVLVLLGQTGTAAATGATAAALAQQEYAHLRRALPGFDLVETSVPLVASIVYWAVYGTLVLAAVTIPLGVRRARRMRADARRRVAQRQHQVRGSKIARRQATRRR